MKGAGRGDEKIEKVATLTPNGGRLTTSKEARQRTTRIRIRAINIKMGEQEDLEAE